MSADHELPENPYPGLRPFQADETHLFFGRDVQTAALLRRLQRSRFLAIVGTSGSGKSSLVRAGMLQGLYGGLVAGGSQWRVVDLRPGTQPMANLAAALDRPGALRDEGCSADDSFTDATLRRSALGLVQAVREARLAPRERVLVLVDQFEELFRAIDGGGTQHVDDDAAAFVQLLLEAARQDELPIYVALTMRSDFLGECARFRDLPEAISDGQYLIPRLTRDQLREAITGPAAVHGVALSDRLVDRLLNDLGGNPDQLPILQHALMRTWNLWARDPARGRTLDLADYERIGGMAHALSRHADEVLASLGDAPVDAGVAPRRVAECLFKALATLGPGGQEVRRFASVQAVADIAGVSPDAVIAVVEAFRAPGNSFLMPPVGEPLAPATDIDISHESLIRNWTMVRGWLGEEAESQRIYERVATTAALHAQGQAGLLPGPDLSRALAWRQRQRPTAAWARRYDGDFAQAMDFIDDSQARAAFDERASAGSRRRMLAALVLSLLAVLGLSLSWLAEESARRFALEATASEAMQRIELARHLARAHKLGSEVDAATCAALAERMGITRGADESGPQWLERTARHRVAMRPAFEALCDKQAASASAAHWFDPFFEFSETLAQGRIEDAAAQVDALDDYLRIPAQVLLDAKIALASSQFGSERREFALRQEQLVGEMAQLHADYRQTGRLDADRCRGIQAVIEREPGWAHLFEIADWLCEAERESRADFFHISGLMLAGHVDTARGLVDERLAETDLEAPASALWDALLELQSPQDRAERAELVRLHLRSERPAAGAGAASRAPVFRHPVHARIARQLLAAPAALAPADEWLLKAYRELGQDPAYRQRVLRAERAQDPDYRELLQDPAYRQRVLRAELAQDPDYLRHMYLRHMLGAELGNEPPPDLPDVYVDMVWHAAKHESAGVVLLADHARTYGASLLIVLSWPAWWAWRQWQRRRGLPIGARPGAWRRALAAVFDGGIALAMFMAVGFTTAEILDAWTHGPEWLVELGPILLAVAAAWSYLLFGDALPLRHQRSLGKIAFHLRPVRFDAGPAAGRIPWAVAARRGLSLTVAMTLLTAVVIFGASDDDAGLEWLAAYVAFPLLVLTWLPMALMRDGRTWGDRWSGTHVIDVDSDASYRVDAPPRYLDAAPVPAAPGGATGG